MDYDREGPVVEKTKKLLEFRNAAAGIAAGLIVSVIYKKEDIVKFLDNAEIGKVSYVGALQSLCIIVIIALAILWMYTGTDELEDLQFWLRPLNYRPKRPASQAFSIFAVSIILAITLCLVDHIALFVIFYCVYLALDLYTWKIRRDEILIVFKGSLAALQERIQRFLSSQELRPHRSEGDRRLKARLGIYQQGCLAIHDYYIKRPHYLRIALLLALFVIAAVPANYIHIYHLLHADKVEASVTNVPIPFSNGYVSNFEQLAIVFYIYWLVLIVGSEAVLNLVWRRRLKIRLEELRDQLERLAIP